MDFEDDPKEKKLLFFFACAAFLLLPEALDLLTVFDFAEEDFFFPLAADDFFFAAEEELFFEGEDFVPVLDFPEADTAPFLFAFSFPEDAAFPEDFLTVLVLEAFDCCDGFLESI